MKSMIAGRKTLLALAVSSVMTGWATQAVSAELDPVIDPTANVEIAVGDSMINAAGSAITSTTSGGVNITNHGILKGSEHAIHVQAGAGAKSIFNNKGAVMEAENGAAILVEEGGSISYINNEGTIIGGILTRDDGTKEQVAIDIRGANSEHIDSVKVGSKGKGGTIVGNIYMNNKDGLTNVDSRSDKSSYVAFYGAADDKAIFDGKLIANVFEVNVQSSGHMLLKAQDETIVFDLVDAGPDLANLANGKFEIKKGSEANLTTLEMELGDTLGSGQAVLDVKGDVKFNDFTQVLVTGDVEKVAGQHTLITADTITGFEDDMVKGTWLTDAEVVGTGDDNSITVDITVKEKFDPEELTGEAAEFGADGTEQAVLGAFAGYYAENASSSDGETVTYSAKANEAFLAELGALLNVGGESAAKLSGELTPDRSGAKLHAAQRTQNRQLDAIGHRMNSLRADQYHAVNSANSGLWMQVYGHDGKKDVSGRIDGYDAKGMGFSFGIDGELGDNMITGLAFSQSHQDINTITYDTNYDVDAYQLSAYGLWNQDQYFVTGTVNAGINYFDSYRTIGEGTTGVSEYRANAEFKSIHYAARLTAGMDLAFDNVLIQPLIAAEVNQVEVEDYEESGSIASLGYEKQSISQVKMGLGANVTTSFEVGEGILTPSFSAMGWYDFNADDQEISGYVVETPTVEGSITTANGSSETRFDLRAGFDYTTSGALSAGLALQHAIEDDTKDTQLQLRLNYAF